LPAAQLTDVDTSTESQLLDLSVIDGRYAPAVISACAGEIVRLWEAATAAGDRKPLEAWCTPAAARQLFHPTPHGLRRVLNLETRRIRIEALDARSDPPTVSVALDLRGQRWLATADGDRLSGSRRRHREFTERWTLCLDTSQSSPWRLTDVDDPGRA
jgi:predicted lipid-binding transport protein (Tim44 family)